MKLRIVAASAAPLLAVSLVSPAYADDFVVLKTTAHRTVVAANLATLQRNDGKVRVEIFIFPRSGSGADLMQADAELTCGRNVMNSWHTKYYDVTIAGGRLQSHFVLREEVSDFNGNTGTMYGLDNTVYDTLLPLCSGVPTGARRESGDTHSVFAKLAAEFVK